MTTSLEYLAGILDVSGALVVTHRKDTPGPRVYVLIRSRDRRWPEMFAAQFGGAVYQCGEDGQCWGWVRQGRNCQAVLHTLRPFIRLRTLEFDRILSMQLRGRGAQPGVPRSRRTKRCVGADFAAAMA